MEQDGDSLPDGTPPEGPNPPNLPDLPEPSQAADPPPPALVPSAQVDPSGSGILAGPVFATAAPLSRRLRVGRTHPIRAGPTRSSLHRLYSPTNTG